MFSAEISARAAAVVDITPRQFPVLVNGGFLPKTASKVHSRLHARALVLHAGATRLALVVVDSCMLPRSLIDEAKQLAVERAALPSDNILISVTHCHSAPSCLGALGTDPDENYVAFVKPLIAEAVIKAADNLEPAEVGYGAGNAAPYTAVRRWIRRSDRVELDPFGNRTVRANMHPGHQSLDATGPSGPEDPALALLSVRSRDRRPIALLANFSMHYYAAGVQPISADYFGLFCDRIRERIAPGSGSSPRAFVGIMSHAPSGDIWWRDYFEPKPDKPPHDLSSYADALVDIAANAYATIEYEHEIDLSAAYTELPLRYRTPSAERLAWARGVVDAMKGRGPKNRVEVYAREAIFLHDKQKTSLPLQAFRIGSIGVTAIPNEVYALTGLKIKEQSPLQPTINIELAGGGEGYIPAAGAARAWRLQYVARAFGGPRSRGRAEDCRDGAHALGIGCRQASSSGSSDSERTLQGPRRRATAGVLAARRVLGTARHRHTGTSRWPLRRLPRVLPRRTSDDRPAWMRAVLTAAFTSLEDDCERECRTCHLSTVLRCGSGMEFQRTRET